MLSYLWQVLMSRDIYVYIYIYTYSYAYTYILYSYTYICIVIHKYIIWYPSRWEPLSKVKIMDAKGACAWNESPQRSRNIHHIHSHTSRCFLGSKKIMGSVMMLSVLLEKQDWQVYGDPGIPELLFHTALAMMVMGDPQNHAEVIERNRR